MAASPNVWIRNLTRFPVNLRLGSAKDVFHITLKPRGVPGEIVAVPRALTEHPNFLRSKDQVFEVVSKSVAEKAVYAPLAPPPGRVEVTIERPQDNTISSGTINVNGRVVTYERSAAPAPRGEIEVTYQQTPQGKVPVSGTQLPLPVNAGVEILPPADPSTPTEPGRRAKRTKAVTEE